MKKHKMFKYNEHLPTTLSMITDTFQRGIQHKNGLAAIVKHIVETQTLHLNQLTSSLDA